MSRPHAKTHKCPTIAKPQLAGGSVGNDQMYAIRNDGVEAVWPIAARGRSQ